MFPGKKVSKMHFYIKKIYTSRCQLFPFSFQLDQIPQTLKNAVPPVGVHWRRQIAARRFMPDDVIRRQGAWRAAINRRIIDGHRRTRLAGNVTCGPAPCSTIAIARTATQFALANQFFYNSLFCKNYLSKNLNKVFCTKFQKNDTKIPIRFLSKFKKKISILYHLVAWKVWIMSTSLDAKRAMGTCRPA